MNEQVLEQPAKGLPLWLVPDRPGQGGRSAPIWTTWRARAGTRLHCRCHPAAVGILVLVSTLYRPDFLSYETLLSVTFTMAVLGVVTVAQSLVTISGGILDLSIPTALILPSWVIVTLLGHGVNLVPTILVGLLTGARGAASTPSLSCSASSTRLWSRSGPISPAWPWLRFT